MSKKYLRWKNADCNGQDIEWEEMNGKDFFDFFCSDARKDRYFVVLTNDICREADVIFIEATKEQYDDWFKEYCHHRYINKLKPSEGVLSLDSEYESIEGITLHELVSDITEVPVEERVIEPSFVDYILVTMSLLSKYCREAVELKYFIYPDKTDAEIAELLGIKEQTFRKRKTRGIMALKNYFKK